MEMSVNRALSELKLLGKRIESKTQSLNVAQAVTGGVVEVQQAFKVGETAKIQSLKDMIVRRNKIKAAIVMSNASTKVTIGSDEMFVAEAIERKSSIELEKALNRQIRERYYGHKQAVENHNNQAKAKADKQAEAALGAATEGDKGIQYTSIFDAYYNSNKAELVCVDGIEKIIDDDQDKIDSFESEVDFILSESNTKTMITV